MSTADAVAGVLWIGATLYAVFGGADFGAGVWSLLAGGDERGARARSLVDWAIGPVWEANHVWLIFVLVVLWTAFSVAFESIMSTLFIPLSLAALGIVLRGSGFAFHKLARQLRYRRLAERALRALLAPDAVLHGHGGRRDRLRSTAGGKRRRRRRHELAERGLPAHRRALCRHRRLPLRGVPGQRRPSGEGPGPGALLRDPRPDRGAGDGAIALPGIFVYRADARFIYDGLTSEGLPLVIASALCGLGVLALLWRGERRGARPLAVGAVVAVIWGWGVAQYPYLLPQTLTINEGAARARR